MPIATGQRLLGPIMSGSDNVTFSAGEHQNYLCFYNFTTQEEDENYTIV